MPVPTDARVFWPESDASIPTDWTRDTNFDDHFLQGDDETFTGAATTAAATHLHSIPVHTHTAATHSHRFSGAAASAISNSSRTSSKPVVRYCVRWSHSHTQIGGNSTAVTYQNASAQNTGTTGALPPYYTMIMIGPDDALQDIPDDAVCFTDESTAPTGFSITDGTAGTPNLDDKFLLGADTGNDGGGTGGTATHTHTSSGHTHTANSHSHASITCGSATTIGAFSPLSAPTPTTPSAWHHGVSMSSATSSNLDSDSPSTDAISSEPAYIKLLGIQNTSGSATLPDDVVIPWVASAASIPAGWDLMDGGGTTTDCRDKQIKVTETPGEIGDTGGADSHTHTVTHNHTTTGTHTHSTGETDHLTTYTIDSGITITAKNANHNHTWTVVAKDEPDSDNASPVTDSKDVRYNYRTVVFIKKVTPSTLLKDVIMGGIIPFSR